MEKIQDIIFQHFSRYKNASVMDIAIALQITRADAQYHLVKLWKKGVLIRQTYRLNDHPGKPKFLYSLADSNQPNNYIHLVEAFLTAFFVDYGTQLPANIASYMISGYKAPKSTVAGMNTLIRFLNSHNYNAKWEAHAPGPRIIFRNCPYAALVKKHPVLCKIDQNILMDYLGTKLKIEMISSISTGDTKCVFSCRDS